MHYPKLTSFFLLLFIITIAASCKKNAGLNFNAVKIASVDYYRSGGTVYHYRITYNAFNTVDSIVTTGGGTDTGTNSFSVFSYTGSSFLITDQQGLSYGVYANTNGMILEVLKTDTMLMTYNGNELTELDYKSPSNTPPYYIINAVTYNWRGGDIISYGPSQGAMDSVYYDPRHIGQVGDALRIDDFLTYGRSLTSTADLPAELKYANGKEDYYYTFDGQGRISTLRKVISDNNSPNDTADYIYKYY